MALKLYTLGGYLFLILVCLLIVAVLVIRLYDASIGRYLKRRKYKTELLDELLAYHNLIINNMSTGDQTAPFSNQTNGSIKSDLIDHGEYLSTLSMEDAGYVYPALVSIKVLRNSISHNQYQLSMPEFDGQNEVLDNQIAENIVNDSRIAITNIRECILNCYDDGEKLLKVNPVSEDI